MARTRTRLLEIAGLLVVVATAAGARVGYQLAYADQGASAAPFHVQDDWPTVDLETGPVDELDMLTGNLRDHRWFGGAAPFASGEEQTAHVAPGYPYLVYGAGLVDLGAPRDQLIRWLQCGLGAVTAGLYFLFARRAFQSKLVGLLAGVFCALNPFAIISSAELNDGVLASFMLAAVVYLGMRAGRHGDPLTSLFYGVALAGLALTRAALLPFALVALLWFLWRSRSLAQGWLSGTLALLGLVIALTPWTLRNWTVFGDACPVVTTTWYHLWMGNNPNATGGPLDETAVWSALAQEDPELAGRLAGMPQLERYQSLAQPTLAEVTHDGPALARRRLWAGLYFFFGADWFRTGLLYRQGPASLEQADLAWRSFYPGLLAGSLFGMLILGVLGWRWTFGWRKEAMPSSLAVMWVPLPYILGHAEALSGPRLPLDGVLLTFAAFALVCLVPGLGRRLLERDRPADTPT